GKLDKNNQFLKAVFDRRLAAARADEAAPKPYEAYLGYEALAKDFKGLTDTTEVEKKAAALRNSKEVKQAQRLDNDQIARQEAREKELESLKRIALSRASTESGATPPDTASRTAESGEDRASAFADLKKAIAGLRKKADEPSPDQIVWRRTLQAFLVGCYET